MSYKLRGNVLRGLGTLLVVGMVAGISFAEGTSAPVVNGFVDTTYMYNFNRPADQKTELRSFDQNDNNFSLNGAQIAVTGTMEDVGYTVKLLAGSDAAVIAPLSSTAAGATNNVDFTVEEGYFTYKCPVTGITTKVGKFVTTEGIEVIESKDDPTISRGYLFGLAEPFTHTGVMLSRVFGKVEIGAGLVNGWDLTVDNNKSKDVLGKIGLNFGDPLSLVISGIHGSEQSGTPTLGTAEGNNRDSLDITAASKILPKTVLNAQWNWGQEKHALGVLPDYDKWTGVGLQPVVSITDKFSIGARVEQFYNKQGSRLAPLDPGVPATDHVSVTNYTIAPAYKCTANTMVRAEFRADTSNKKIFLDDKGKFKDSTSSASLEWIVTF
ncbi:MAG: porin [Elusimicrobia bacterium]|nr:porin [Elusimicrobiota bacterium]